VLRAASAIGLVALIAASWLGGRLLAVAR
jgi:hypothetical protein